jgi:hypothetical protein
MIELPSRRQWFGPVDKASKEYTDVGHMVLLIGGALSLIIGLIGILNFMNTVLVIWLLQITLPVLLFLSILIPKVSLSATDKMSIVEKLREIEG